MVPLITEANPSKELLNRESRAAHKSLIEPTPKSTLPSTRTYSSSQQQSPTSPTTSRLKTRRSKTSVEKPKAKKPLKTYGRSSQDIYEFHGGSDGELAITPRMDLGHKAGKCKKNGKSRVDKTSSRQGSQDEDSTRRPITTAGGDTKVLSTEPKRHESSSAGERDISLQSSMPPPTSRFTSLEQSQRSGNDTIFKAAEPTAPECTTSDLLSPIRSTYVEISTGDRTSSPTRSSYGVFEKEIYEGFVQSGDLHPLLSNEDEKATGLQSIKEPAPSSSASEISPSKAITVETTKQSKEVLPELSLLASEHLRSQVDSNTLTMANPVVLLPAPMDTEGSKDELSLSIPETASKGPAKTAKASKRKRDADNEAVADELGSDDHAIGIPKEHYQPRPSKRRSGCGDEEVLVPTDFSKKPEAASKVKRKPQRHKTTAFQELLPKDEDEEEEEEFKTVPDSRFEIPEKKSSNVCKDGDQPNVERKDITKEIRREARPEVKQPPKAISQKKRGRPKKVVAKLSEEIVLDGAESDHDQEEAEAEEPVISAPAKTSRKKTKSTETPTPLIDEQDCNHDGTPAAEEALEDLPADVLNETHGNIPPPAVAAKRLPETSPDRATAAPETPRKSTTPAPKGPDKHSPISSGKMAYRVGLSKRARIAPLLRIVRK